MGAGMIGEDQHRGARTVLEEQIRARRMTFEEFIDYAENFARDNGQSGTLSLRHLHRLASGRPAGTPRPATRRLLEAIFGVPWEQLVAPPEASRVVDEAQRLSVQLRTAQRVDPEVVQLLADQIDAIRQLDRRFGATSLLSQLRQHVAHIEELLAYAVNLDIRRGLAAVLTDAHALAGWQSLDLGHTVAAWNHLRQACEAAHTAESPALLAFAQAEQAVVLADAGETTSAVELTEQARKAAQRHVSPLLRAWLAAAHGEALARGGRQSASLHAFDEALSLLPSAQESAPSTPYLSLNEVHLTRWRGHALARFGHPDAVEVLTEALARHDPSFVRAQTGLLTDLAFAHAARAEHDEAASHRQQARELARVVGSARQLRRLDRLSDSNRVTPVLHEPAYLPPTRP